MKGAAKNQKQASAAPANKAESKGKENKATDASTAKPQADKKAPVAAAEPVAPAVPWPTGVGIVPPESISFPKMEEAVLSFWQRIKAFETSVKFSEGKPR